jgi:YbbR domain-containing protein
LIKSSPFGQVELALRRVFNSLRSNVGSLAISVALATAFWVVITNEENPERTDELPFAIAVEAVNISDDVAVFGSIEPVTIRVTAREHDFEELEAGDFRAVADVGNAGPGQFKASVSVDYTGGRRGIDVEDVSPDTVIVNLEPLIERTLPVDVQITDQPPFGLTPEVVGVEPEDVVVSGPAGAVDLVAAVAAEIDLSSVTVPVEDFEADAELVARNEAGFAVEGVSLSASEAEVLINVEREILQQAVPIVPTIEGTLPPGLLLSDISAGPQTVTVSGPLDVLDTIESLATEAIDLSEISETTTVSVELVVPTGADVEIESARVTLTVVAREGEAAYAVAPTFINVAPGLRPSTTTAILLVRVSGPLAALEELSAGDLTVLVDMAFLGAGTHTLTPSVEAPDGIEVVEVTPATIDVTLSP